jgi:hypothetical protein
MDAIVEEDEEKLRKRMEKYLDSNKQAYYDKQSITELLAE